jgi:hypothetical protein
LRSTPSITRLALVCAPRPSNSSNRPVWQN